MTESKQDNKLGSPSVDTGLTFTIKLEQFNSAFGISADTLRLLAASYNVTPEVLINRAVTMWAKAIIPDLDLDCPSLTAAQIDLLLKHQQASDPSNSYPQQTLAEYFKETYEETGDYRGNAESSPRNGGHS